MSNQQSAIQASERNIVIRQRLGWLGPCRMRRRTVAAIAHRTAAATATAAATSAEQHDAIAANLGRRALVAVLVIPLARLQAALDVDLLALDKILGERFG